MCSSNSVKPVDFQLLTFHLHGYLYICIVLVLKLVSIATFLPSYYALLHSKVEEQSSTCPGCTVEGLLEAISVSNLYCVLDTLLQFSASGGIISLFDFCLTDVLTILLKKSMNIFTEFL